MFINIKRLWKAGTEVADACEATGICRKVIAVYSTTIAGICLVAVVVPCGIYRSGKVICDSIKTHRTEKD